MNAAEIIESLRIKLAMPGGRHLYGVLGTYELLQVFADSLSQSKNFDGMPFSTPLNVNLAILRAMPDEEFKKLVTNEARRPEPTAAYVAKAFDSIIRKEIQDQKLLILSELEMLFAYHLELNLLRTLAADEQRILLLLPGKRHGGKIVMFPGLSEESYILPTNLLADNHMWELRLE